MLPQLIITLKEDEVLFKGDFYEIHYKNGYINLLNGFLALWLYGFLNIYILFNLLFYFQIKNFLFKIQSQKGQIIFYSIFI